MPWGMDNLSLQHLRGRDFFPTQNCLKFLSAQKAALATA